ncbi:MAG: DUF58 domain-containing protein [Sandaracinus sp.]|nr:DUF58 domain-containing protein [Sandaracinus sp.]
MLPLPSRHGVIAFLGLVSMLVVGLAFQSSAAIGLAGAGFVGLGAALAATLPAGRRLRHQRLEFAWWLDHGTGVAAGSVVPGTPFEVRCFLRHRGADDLHVASLEPLVPPEVKADSTPSFVVPGRSRTELRIRLMAPAIGRVVLHGLAVRLRGPLGLFETPLYFPNPLVIKVLPRSAAGAEVARSAMPRGSAMERSGKTRVRRRGGGTELHELRDLVPGDPFKSIAWKASARRGRLLVREVEQEVQEVRWLIVDVSGTMRGGEPGRRKLDWALEAAAAEARRALAGGDRVGLVAFDTRVVGQVAPGEGKAHRIRLYDALLATTELVDEDLTDLSDEGLLDRVARYVRQQDGLDFRRRRGGIDVPALVEHCARALGTDDREGKAIREVRASTTAEQTLRAFCRARGLRLPHHADPAERAKANALGSALHLAGGTSREPGAIFVVTDLDGITDLEGVLASLRLARLHGNRVTFLLPDGRTFAPAPKSPEEEALHKVYGRSEERRLREARVELGRLGAHVVVVSADEPPALALPRAERGGRRAA